MKRVRLLFLLLFSCMRLFAQQPATVHLREYTTENGLPSNGIKGIQWDDNSGFLWIATEAGIVRFNGVDFRSFTKENMPEISSERMVVMTRNMQGRIFITDLRGNIFSVDQGKPFLWWQPGLPSNPYFDNYYLLCVSDTFFRKQVYKKTTPVFSALTDNICPTSDTSCYILHQGGLFYNSMDKPQAGTVAVEGGPFVSLFKIKEDVFVRNSAHNIFRLIRDKNRFYTEPVPVSANLPLGSASSRIFWDMGMNEPVLVENDKAWALNSENNELTGSLICTGVPADVLIRTLHYIPQYQLLVLGTDSKGLIVLRQNQVQSMRRITNDALKRNSYYAQVELGNGIVLTNEGDIIGGSVPESSLPVKGKFSFNLVLTPDSVLWYQQASPSGTSNCLYQYDYHSRKTIAYPKLNHGEIIAEADHRDYLVNREGLGYLSGDSMLYLLKTPNPELTEQIIYDFREVSPGVLGIARCGGYMEYHIRENRLDTIYQDSKTCVRTFWKYGDYIFLGTYGSGYFAVHNGKAMPMPLDKNKYLLYTHCFVPDGKGFCWISTNRGLFKVSLADMTDAASGKASSIYYHYFGKNDGMEMTELNGGCTPCALRLSNGILSFPTMDGLLWVNPEKAKPAFPNGAVYVDEVFVDNKPLDAGSFGANPLPAGPHDIVFSLAYTAWGNKENINLEYQLNDTSSWIPVRLNNESEIRLNHVSPGDYTLYIRKRNGFGSANYSYKTIRFSIRIPWYNQWWFYLLSVFGIFGLIFFLVRMRTRRYRLNQLKLEKQIDEKTKELKEKNEVLEKSDGLKTKLISIISHDIVTPLKFITVAGMNLREKRNQIPAELQDETIREIANTSQELQLLSTNILNWIKYQHENRRLTKEEISVHDTAQQVFSVLNSLARQKNIGLVNQVSLPIRIYQYFEPLKILLYNLVLNAINFSEKGNVTVSFELKENNGILRVSDQGVGMTADQIQNLLSDQIIISSANIDKRKGNGLGYLIIKDLVKTTGSRLDIQSEKGNGTTVIIIMPVQKPVS